MSRRVLVVTSGGGHWAELRRLYPALDGVDVSFASVRPEYASQVPGHPYFVLPDFHRRKLWPLPIAFVATIALMLRLRPEVIVSTGAAPGLLALALGKWLVGARTIWIDSLANAETLSGSGKWARLVADVWLTQWGHLARDTGPHYWGAVV